MAKNSIVVNLQGQDPTTGKYKKVIHDYLIIKNNLEMRHGMIIEFIEQDGTATVPANELQRQLFFPKQIALETEGKFLSAQNGFESAQGAPDAVTSLDYWQSIDLTKYPVIAAMPDNVKQLLSEIKISDLVYWLIEQSILKGNNQGKY